MLKSFRQMSFCNRNMFVSFGEKMQTLRLVFFCIKIIDLRSFEETMHWEFIQFLYVCHTCNFKNVKKHVNCKKALAR